MLEVAHTDKKVEAIMPPWLKATWMSDHAGALPYSHNAHHQGDGSWAASAGCAVTADTTQVRSLMSNRSLRVFCSHAGMLC